MALTEKYRLFAHNMGMLVVSAALLGEQKAKGQTDDFVESSIVALVHDILTQILLREPTEEEESLIWETIRVDRTDG